MLYFMYIDGHLDKDQMRQIALNPELERFEQGPDFCVASFHKPINDLQEFEYLKPNWVIASNDQPQGSIRNFEPTELHMQRLTKYAESLRVLFKTNVRPDAPSSEMETVKS